ncbi:hypothetical protein SANTM175S_09323 [Streptomyces antimycoticus]
MKSLKQSLIRSWETREPTVAGRTPCSLSPLQEGLLFHTVYDEEGPDVYNVQLAFELDGALDLDALKAAAHALRPHGNGALLCRLPAAQVRRVGSSSSGAPRAPWQVVDLRRCPRGQ